MYMNPIKGVNATICAINPHDVNHLQQELSEIGHLYIGWHRSGSHFYHTSQTNIMFTLIKDLLFHTSTISKLPKCFSVSFIYVHVFVIIVNGIRKINW